MNPIYLDYNATTPLDDRVLEAMLPFLRGTVGNASSVHGFGRVAKDAVEQARAQVASLVGCRPSDVIFTSGATEANNLVLKGLVEANRSGRRRLLVSAGEHKSVLDTASWVDSTGLAKTELVPLTQRGTVDLARLEQCLSDDVLVVSMFAANSETGVLNPLRTIGEVCRSVGALFHTDATQWLGRLPLALSDIGADFVSLSGHKIHGPTGIGALCAGPKAQKRLVPILHGGGQEQGLRSGTVNVPGVVGLGAAAAIVLHDREADSARLRMLSEALLAGLRRELPDVVLQGEDAERLPNTLNIRFIGADAEAVMVNMPDVAVSTGSACSAGSIEPSHVLSAMGLDRGAADEVLRFSLGRFTTPFEIDQTIAATVHAVRAVRRAMGA